VHIDNVLVGMLHVKKPYRHIKSHASATQVMMTFWQSHTLIYGTPLTEIM